MTLLLWMENQQEQAGSMALLVPSLLLVASFVYFGGVLVITKNSIGIVDKDGLCFLCVKFVLKQIEDTSTSLLCIYRALNKGGKRVDMVLENSMPHASEM